MITDFFIKGLLRDNSRSLLPIIVVAIGVFSVVFISGYISGSVNNFISKMANTQTGHVKIVSRAYWEEKDQQPLDLALKNAKTLISSLQSNYPKLMWAERIPFFGLLDLPTNKKETKTQGPVVGVAYDMLSGKNANINCERLKLKKALINGDLIKQAGEVIISVDFAEKYNVNIGDSVTFLGSTMYNSMTFGNYTIAGIMTFGSSILNKGAILMDIADARLLLDMEDAVSEVMGFFPDNKYDRESCEELKDKFNKQYAFDKDEYAPQMVQLADQQGMDETLEYAYNFKFTLMSIFIFALSIMLWNTGIIISIRRYNEFGLRLALGEEIGHIYRILLLESLIIGFVGSTIGTILGLLGCLYINTYGLDYSAFIDEVPIMMDTTIYAEILPHMYYIGFIVGIFSILIGTALAGRAIYKRKTAGLFKELD